MKNKISPARAFAALISGGSSGDFDGEGFAFIGRQNSNAARRCHGLAENALPEILVRR
jgi:hypothetical protein